MSSLHSFPHFQKGIRTYPHGFDPVEGASFVGCKSYRNEKDGVFFRNSRNLTVIGGIFADNREQIEFDRAEYITLCDATVIGVSPEFRELMQAQGVDAPCTNGKVVGVQLHAFTRDSRGNGATLKNVSFSGFAGTGCDQAYAIDFDDEVRDCLQLIKLWNLCWKANSQTILFRICRYAWEGSTTFQYWLTFRWKMA